MQSLATKLICLWCSFGILVCVAPCCADFVDWEGSGTGGVTTTSPADSQTQWNVGANWDRGYQPGSFDVADLRFENPGRVYMNSTSVVKFIYLSGSEPDAKLLLEFGANVQVGNSLYVPSSGRGEVEHNGGTLTSNAIFIGDEAGESGRYQFDGGSVVAEKLLIAVEGTGEFLHNGGQLSVSDRMLIGPGGRFDYFDGGFSLTGRLVVDGVLDFHNRTAQLNLPAERLSDISGSLVNAERLSINVPANSLLVLPMGFNPAMQLGSLTGGGLIHNRGDTLVVPANSLFAAPAGEFRDPIDISGEVTTVGTGMSFAGGGILRSEGTINYSDKTLSIFGGAFEIAGGTINAASVAVDPVAHVVQTGGTHHLTGNLLINGDATYVHEAGQINANAIRVSNDGRFTTTATKLNGVSGLHSSFGGLVTLAGQAVDIDLIRSNRGNFLQTSGHSKAESLELIDGQFELRGGSLTVGSLYVQFDLPGEFIITDPAAQITITDRLSFGREAAFESITAPSGAVIRMEDASFEHRGILRDPPQFSGKDARDNMLTVEMAFSNPGGGISTIEAPGEDRGPVAGGFQKNFALGTLRIGGPTTGALQLVDDFRNLCQAFSCLPSDNHDALYVDHLILHDNATLDLNGLRLYYRELTNLGGVVQSNGGELLAIVTLPGDYNSNGVVDAADYTVWQDTLGAAVTAGTGADGDSDGIVEPDDYAVWKLNFGNTAGNGAASGTVVPEPSSAILAGLLLAGLATDVRRRCRAIKAPLS